MSVNVLQISTALATSSAETSDRLLPPCWQLHASNGNNTDNKGAAYQINMRHTRKLAMRQRIEKPHQVIVANLLPVEFNNLAIVLDKFALNDHAAGHFTRSELNATAVGTRDRCTTANAALRSIPLKPPQMLLLLPSRFTVGMTPKNPQNHHQGPDPRSNEIRCEETSLCDM